MALKDTGQNLNKRHIRLMQKLKFPGIPDDFEKKIGSSSGIDKNFGFGSGIGYPLGPVYYSFMVSLVTLFQGTSRTEDIMEETKDFCSSLLPLLTGVHFTKTQIDFFLKQDYTKEDMCQKLPIF